MAGHTVLFTSAHDMLTDIRAARAVNAYDRPAPSVTRQRSCVRCVRCLLDRGRLQALGWGFVSRLAATRAHEREMSRRPIHERGRQPARVRGR